MSMLSVLLTRRPTRDHPDTTAVDPKYQETITIHDREFQKFSVDNTIHLVPIDDVGSRIGRRKYWLTHGQEEAERLEHQNRVFNLIFDGRLIFPPLHGLRNVLDCGYGSASWAVEVAESYPNCEVNSVNRAVRDDTNSFRGYWRRHLPAHETRRHPRKFLAGGT